jgi:hypothetical protein
MEVGGSVVVLRESRYGRKGRVERIAGGGLGRKVSVRKSRNGFWPGHMLFLQSRSPRASFRGGADK